MDNSLDIFKISDYFLSIKGMTHKKLQKLCYYAQAYHLAILGKKLFQEDFQAWIHGPVCPDLYNNYRGSFYIDKIDNEPVLKDNIKEFLKIIYLTYGNMTGDELEELTHSEMPWKKARMGLTYNEISNNIINEEDMKEYYKTILNQ